MSDAAHEIDRLLAVMAALRHPDTGCPWDKEQDFDSIAPYTIEEAFEVADAIARKDWDALPDELGDLLFQIAYYARVAEEDGRFDFAAVARSITEKMIRRHPHVFASASVEAGFWENGKEAERKARNEHATLAAIPHNLPALIRALKLTRRAARVGFDWPDATQVLAKLEEEILELRAELDEADRDRLEDELGDMLFCVVNLGRKLDIDPEAALRRANAKFQRRFEAMEAAAEQAGGSLRELDLDAMEALWRQAKRAERAVAGE